MTILSYLFYLGNECLIIKKENVLFGQCVQMKAPFYEVEIEGKIYQCKIANKMSITEITIDGTRYELMAIPNQPKPSHTQQEPERIEITNLGWLKQSNCVEVYFNKNVDDFKDKFPLVKEAIEKVLNSEPVEQDTFVWSDELAAQFFEYCREDNAGVLTPFGVRENVKMFKKYKAPSPKPQVLFTTQDGVEYMEGEKKEIWGVHTKEGYNSVGAYHPDVHPEYYPQLSVHYEYFFSTKEKADEWVRDNQPKYSLEDFRKIVRTISDGTKGHDARSYLYFELHQLANKNNPPHKTNNQ